jgi:hypothetical protein
VLFPPVPRFGSIPLFLLPLPNELTEAPDTTKEKTQRNHQKQHGRRRLQPTCKFILVFAVLLCVVLRPD